MFVSCLLHTATGSGYRIILCDILFHSSINGCLERPCLTGAGGGAVEMELSYYLREHSHTIAGKEQLLISAYAKALEVIPRQLCDNAGFDATNILNKLRQKHALGEHTILVDGTIG